MGPRVGPSITQNSGPTGSSTRAASQGRSCSKPQSSIPISRRRPPLAFRTSKDPRRCSRSCSPSASASRITQPAAPEHDDQRPQPEAMALVAGLAHDRDDLLHSRRVGGIAQSLVARRTSRVSACAPQLRRSARGAARASPRRCGSRGSSTHAPDLRPEQLRQLPTGGRSHSGGSGHVAPASALKGASGQAPLQEPVFRRVPGLRRSAA
jgi:hypothetical protein